MLRPRAVEVLIALVVGLILLAAAVSGSSETESLAVGIEVECPEVASPARVELQALEPLRTFDEAVAGAERVVTGTVVEQRLGYLARRPNPRFGLISRLDEYNVSVIHRIAPRCSDGSLILAFWPSTPPLEAGRAYAIVVGAQRPDGTREALLVYNLDSIKITQYWPVSDSPIGGGSTLPHLIDAIEN